MNHATLPTSSDYPEDAAAVAKAWHSIPRRLRRGAALAWWQQAQRTEPTWPEQWRCINEARGVVDAPHPYSRGKSPLDP
jgi:hypothetical protein